MFPMMNILALAMNLTIAQAPAQNTVDTHQAEVRQIVETEAVNKAVESSAEIPAEATLEENGHKATAEHKTGFDLNEVINHHLGDSKLWDFQLLGYSFPITKRVVMMWIAAFFMLAVFIPAARTISRNVGKRPGRFTSLIEVFVDFIRHDVGHNAMGHHSRSYEPFLLTLFFFILFANLIGLIPPLGEIVTVAAEMFGFEFHVAPGDLPLPVKLWPGITPTGDLSVTATLAIYSFFIIQISGFVYQGIAYLKNIVPGGVPLAIWPIMWPVEVLGQFTKPFALAIRLLANMTAGHMIILVFLGFIFQFQQIAIIPLSVSISVAIYMLEIFVSLLQAYIFVFLTALFIAGSQHRH